MIVDENMNQLKIRFRKLPVKSCACMSEFFVYLSKADQKPRCSQSKHTRTAKKKSLMIHSKRVRRLKKFLNKTDLH